MSFLIIEFPSKYEAEEFQKTINQMPWIDISNVEDHVMTPDCILFGCSVHVVSGIHFDYDCTK